MRSGYAALVLGSLVLQKDLSGGPSLRSRTAREADGKDGPVGFCPEGNLLSQFQHMLCSQGFCWISETTWGFPLAVVVLLLLWLAFEIWTSSCLARWQAQLRRPVATENHAAQPSSPPLVKRWFGLLRSLMKSWAACTPPPHQPRAWLSKSTPKPLFSNAFLREFSPV